MLLRWVATAILTIAISCTAMAQGYFCPTPDSLYVDAAKMVANSGVQKRMILIYIAFPDVPLPTGYMSALRTDTIPNGMSEFIARQSRGQLDLDVEVLLDPTEPEGYWMARHRSTQYAKRDSVLAIPPSYQYGWKGSTAFNHGGELQAEILTKIYNTYTSPEVNLGNPFENASFVVFLYSAGVLHSTAVAGGYYGGYGITFINKDAFPFLATADYGYGPWSNGWLSGIGQLDAGDDLFRDTEFVLGHEFGHTLGLPHSPPDTYSTTTTSKYYYGVYSGMRNQIIPAQGFVPYHPLDLMRLQWLDVVDVGTSLLDETVIDARSGGSAYRMRLLQDNPDEYFLVTYHGGNGEDVEPDSLGTSIYNSRGLQVWHIATRTASGPCSSLWDLESAVGRFADPGGFGVPGTWATPDATYGYDNLDTWYIDGVGYRRYEEARQYPGDEHDFFGALSGKSEFSFRTNPNTFGLENCARFSGQTRPNSILIRVRDELQGSAVVDFLFAPVENVLAPNGGEILQVGSSAAISWTREFTTDQPGGIINTVDIYCSRGAGYDDQLIASGVDATLGSYQWTPAAAHVGKTCKIRIVYHNVNDTAHVGEDETDAVFTVVDLPDAKFSDVSSQTGLVPPGVPYSAAPGDFQKDEKNDLLITATGGFVSMGRTTGVYPSGAPQFGNVTVSNVTDGRGIVVADFDNDGDQDFFLAHETTPKLYRNQGGTFFDVTASMGLASLAAPSTAACWGDYDRDGWLDLYVVRSRLGYSEPPDYLNIAGEGHRLFRNLGATNGGFVDVTAAAGISGLAGNGSVSASWGDIENDGDLDLIVTNLQEPPTGPGGIGNHLFVNQGNGTFVEEFLDRFPGEFYYCTAAQWADINNDGFLDVAVSCAQPGSAIYFNDGSGHFPDAGRVWFDASGNGYNGVQVFDHDLDGWNDVLWVSRSASEPSQFFSGVPTATGIGFVNNTANVGLSGSSKAVGAVAADYTRDGDLDLFVGRSSSSGQYFYKTDSRSGANSLGRNYVKVRLDSPLKANNRQGIGAAVTVTAGELVQTQVVDGGSGRGGQRDRDLIFGLGDYSGPVTGTVKWPRGHVQPDVPLFVSGPASVDSVNTVVDETMVISNLNAASLIVPGTTFFDWVFSWDTNVACDSSLDVLTFDQVGIQNPCWPGWTTLTPSTPGIVYTYEPKPGGGYLHKFTIYGQDCNLGCSFRYSAFSAMGANQATSATKTKQVKFCPSGF